MQIQRKMQCTGSETLGQREFEFSGLGKENRKMDTKQAEFSFQARWADMDFNGHTKNTAYLDYAADCRMLYFKANGFPMSDFMKLGIGPVVFKDTIQYFREIFMYETFTVSLRLKGQSKDGSKFHLVNEFRKPDGTRVAMVSSEACWFDLKSRKITQPPEKLFEVINQLEKTEDYKEIVSNGTAG